MKLRYLKTEKKVKGIETCESLPKFLQWMRVLPFFKDREITYTRMIYKLQYRENDHEYFPWIDVPTIEVVEEDENTK
jgi:hypothetical protein